MFYENPKREDTSQVDVVQSAPLRWNQHPVISTVLWILGGDGKKSPTLPPTSSIDNFQGGPSGGLNDYLNKHFEQVEKTRRASDASSSMITNKVKASPETESSIDSSNYPSSRGNQASKGIENRSIPIGEETLSQQGDEDQQERSSSSDGTQLQPSIASRQFYYGNGNGNGTPVQASYYSTQQYNGDMQQVHNYPPPYSQTGSSYGAYGMDEAHDNQGFADATPSPQWGFYVAITPPQQEMFSGIKKDLLTIQQQNTSSAQKSAPGRK